LVIRNRRERRDKLFIVARHSMTGRKRCRRSYIASREGRVTSSEQSPEGSCGIDLEIAGTVNRPGPASCFATAPKKKKKEGRGSEGNNRPSARCVPHPDSGKKLRFEGRKAFKKKSAIPARGSNHFLAHGNTRSTFSQGRESLKKTGEIDSSGGELWLGYVQNY